MSKSVGVKKKSIWRDKASWELLMLCVPTLLAFTLFHYVPMIGIILPFKRFMPAKGLFGSPWVGFENFRFLFTSVELARIICIIAQHFIPFRQLNGKMTDTIWLDGQTTVPKSVLSGSTEWLCRC